jgi:F0F1-type ATP synthase membrane subunit c/vacuolar-type H+-ATPase subunit K
MLELFKLIILPVFAAGVGTGLIAGADKSYFKTKGERGMSTKLYYGVLYTVIIYGLICYLVYLKFGNSANTLLASAGVIACVGLSGAPILKGFLLNRLIKLGILKEPAGLGRSIMLTMVIEVIPILALVMYLLVAFGIISK